MSQATVATVSRALLDLIQPGFPQAVGAGADGVDSDVDLFVGLAMQTGYPQDQVAKACRALQSAGRVALSLHKDGRLLGICRIANRQQAGRDAAWVIDSLWPAAPPPNPHPNGVRVVPDPSDPRVLSRARLDEAVSRLLIAWRTKGGQLGHPLDPLIDGRWATSRDAEELIAALCHLGIVQLWGTRGNPRYTVRPRRITPADLRSLRGPFPEYHAVLSHLRGDKVAVPSA